MFQVARKLVKLPHFKQPDGSLPYSQHPHIDGSLPYSQHPHICSCAEPVESVPRLYFLPTDLRLILISFSRILRVSLPILCVHFYSASLNPFTLPRYSSRNYVQLSDSPKDPRAYPGSCPRWTYCWTESDWSLRLGPTSGLAHPENLRPSDLPVWMQYGKRLSHQL